MVTSEQLLKWQLSEFEPLQLMAYRALDKIGYVSFIAPVSGGNEFLTGGVKLTLWDIHKPDLIHEFIGAKTEENERLLSFAVSPDKSWVAVGDASGLLRTFSIQDRKEISSKRSKAGPLVRLAVSTDGNEIATVSYDSEVVVWDAKTLERKSNFKLDARDVKHLQYLGSNELLAAGESMATWDTKSSKKLKSFPSQKYQSAIDLSEDGKKLVFGGNGFLQLWNLAENNAEGELHNVPHREAVVRFSDDGSLVATGTTDGIRLLDVASGNLRQIIDASGAGVTDMHWLPDSKALIVATDSGKIRLWGRRADIDKFGIAPFPEAKLDTTNPNEPANAAQNLATIDLRILPKLPNSKIQGDTFSSINYTAPTTLEDAKAFYTYLLGKQGWAVSSDKANPSSLQFSKNGFHLRLMAYSTQSTETMVNLTNSGNFQISKAPRLSSATTTVYEDISSVIYKSAATLADAEKEMLSKFHDLGWKLIHRLNRSQDNSGLVRNIEFLKGATIVQVMMQPDPTDANLLSIHYTNSLTLNSLPIPPDVRELDWDDSGECQMLAITSASVQDASEFYIASMPKHGWVPCTDKQRIEKELAYLPYFSGQRDAYIAISKTEDGKTRITSGNVQWKQ